MSPSSQCGNFLVEPADLLVVLLPLKPALVGLFSIKLDHTVDDLDLQFGGMTEKRTHDGLVPGG